MKYDIIESAVLNLLGGLTDANGDDFFTGSKYPKKFEGEFGGTFQIPEDFNPLCRYAMVQASGTQFDNTNAGGRYQLGVKASVHVFVGSQRDSRGNAKQEVYEMLDAVESSLHGTILNDANGQFIGELRLFQDSQEFTLANHVCWSASFNLLTSMRVGTGA